MHSLIRGSFVVARALRQLIITHLGRATGGLTWRSVVKLLHNSSWIIARYILTLCQNPLAETIRANDIWKPDVPLRLALSNFEHLYPSHTALRERRDASVTKTCRLLCDFYNTLCSGHTARRLRDSFATD